MTSTAALPSAVSVAGSSSRFRLILSNAKYVSILLALSAVGYFGHQTHWRFGLLEHGEAHAPHNPSPPPAIVAQDPEPKADGWEIKFSSEQSLQKSGVGTVRVEHRSMVERIRATGAVAYNQRLTASLSARVSGSIWRVIKQVGDQVAKGDVLAIIDAVEVGRAKSEFLSSLVEVESKTELLVMLERVTGSVPERQVREARIALREAKIRLLNSEHTLVNLGIGVRREDYEGLTDNDRSAKLQFLGLPEAITRGLDPATTTSNLLPLVASFEGVLIHHDATVGEMVESGKPVLELADMRSMWVKLDVPKEDASKLALGQPLSFSPDGSTDELQSKIVWIGTEVDEQTRTLTVRAEVENPLTSSDANTGREVRRLRANTFGTGSITLRETSQALAVPASAVIHDDDQPLIFVRASDLSFARVEVKLGVRDGKYIEILADGLKPDMEVVSRGGHVLKSEWVLNHVASLP